MTSRNKNIFAFATLTATAALGTALFAAGCGDSGDTTPAYPGANAARTINLKFTDIKDTLKAGKVDTLACVITNADGKRLYKTLNVEIKNVVPADKSAKSGKIEAGDTYATFELNDAEFKAVRSEAATITAVYYNSQATGADKDKILGFSEDTIEWYDTSNNKTSDNDKKSYGEVGSVSFFLDAADVNHILSATPDIIGKGKTTRLAYEVKKVKKVDGKDKIINKANIIDFVTVDGGKYLTKDDATIVGQYKGAEYTEADGIQWVAEFNGGKLKSDKPVYVTDAKIASITVTPNYPEVLVPELVPEKDKNVDYALGMEGKEVTGIPQGTTPGSTSSEKTYGVRQTSVTPKVTWDTTKGGKEPAAYDVAKLVTYAVKNGGKAAEATKATVDKDTNTISLLKAGTYDVVGTIAKSDLTGDKEITGKGEVKAVDAETKVGFNTEAEAKAKTILFKSKAELAKSTSETYNVYAQFVEKGVTTGGFASYLFEIPVEGFVYPAATLKQGSASYPASGTEAALKVTNDKNAYKLETTDKFVTDPSSGVIEVNVEVGPFTTYTKLDSAKLDVLSK